jgi:FtsH-binding integral membrane protein
MAALGLILALCAWAVTIPFLSTATASRSALGFACTVAALLLVTTYRALREPTWRTRHEQRLTVPPLYHVQIRGAAAVCSVWCNVFIVDPGRGGTPAYVWCRQAEARFSLLQLLLLLLQTSPAAGCLLASAESCCHSCLCHNQISQQHNQIRASSALTTVWPQVRLGGGSAATAATSSVWHRATPLPPGPVQPASTPRELQHTNHPRLRRSYSLPVQYPFSTTTRPRRFWARRASWR